MSHVASSPFQPQMCEDPGWWLCPFSESDLVWCAFSLWISLDLTTEDQCDSHCRLLLPFDHRGFWLTLNVALFILFVGFSKQEYRSGCPFPSPVDRVLSELPTMTRLSWVALHGMAYSFIGLGKAVVHVIRLASFLWLWFGYNHLAKPLSVYNHLLISRVFFFQLFQIFYIDNHVNNQILFIPS